MKIHEWWTDVHKRMIYFTILYSKVHVTLPTTQKKS